MSEKNFPKRKRVTVQLSETGYRVGESHHRTKLSDRDVNLIRDLNEEWGFGYKRLAWHFGVSRDTIRQICLYRRRNTTVMERRRVWVEDKETEE